MVAETWMYWVIRWGYADLFSSLLLGIVGLPVPDEILLTYAGYLVHKGTLNLPMTFIVAFIGSSCGITVSFLLGRLGGLYLVERYGYVLKIKPDQIVRTHFWFHHYGKWLLAIGYFVPALRHITAIAAGSSKFETREFALWAYSGAALWSSSFILLGYYFGDRWHQIGQKIHSHLVITAMSAAVIVYVYLLIKFRKRLFHPRQTDNIADHRQ